MSAEQRNREAANELARRAIAAAEARAAEAKRDEAATEPDAAGHTFNDLLHQVTPREEAKQRVDRVMLFGPDPESTDTDDD
jgi:hypothetical protein